MAYKPILKELEVLEGLKWDRFQLINPVTIFQDVYLIEGNIEYEHIPIDLYFRALINKDFSRIKITKLENSNGINIVNYIEEYIEITKRQIQKNRLKIVTGITE